MKRAVPILAVLALSVMPAHTEVLLPAELHTLTLMDSIVTREQIQAFAPTDAVAKLTTFALGEQFDFGVRLRATRALPEFCAASTPTCKEDTDANMHPVRAAIRDVIDGIGTARDGQSLLRLRAGIEALGAIQSGKQSDATLLIPFLSHQSRDIRFATARALRELCIASAETPLRNRYEDEPVPQVRLAISAALGDLAQCSQ